MTPMGPVDRFQVLPLHHQVGICDVDAVEVPQWDSGEEPLVAGEQCIRVQRCLLDAGACEATALQACGIRSAGVNVHSGTITTWTTTRTSTG